jgi:hypothetical protein
VINLGGEYVIQVLEVPGSERHSQEVGYQLH